MLDSTPTPLRWDMVRQRTAESSDLPNYVQFCNMSGVLAEHATYVEETTGRSQSAVPVRRTQEDMAIRALILPLECAIGIKQDSGDSSVAERQQLGESIAYTKWESM